MFATFRVVSFSCPERNSIIIYLESNRTLYFHYTCRQRSFCFIWTIFLNSDDSFELFHYTQASFNTYFVNRGKPGLEVQQANEQKCLHKPGHVDITMRKNLLPK